MASDDRLQVHLQAPQPYATYPGWIGELPGADGPVSIIPFATFSLFHSLTFLRTNILPKFIPSVSTLITFSSRQLMTSRRPPPQAQPGQPAPQRPPPAMLEKLSRAIHLWVKGNYDTAMRFVAYAEMAILARSVLGAITYVATTCSLRPNSHQD